MAALVLAVVLGVAVVLDTDRDVAVELGAAGAVLLLSLGVAAGRFGPIAFALALLGAIYAIPEGERAVPAPVYGAGLLLTGELAQLSIEERLGRFRRAAGVRQRLVAVVAVAAASVPASALALLAAEPDVGRSPGLTAAGALAAVACLALLAAMARVRAAPDRVREGPASREAFPS